MRLSPQYGGRAARRGFRCSERSVRAAREVKGKAGARIKWKGLSPSTKERRPSFFVNDQKGFLPRRFVPASNGDIFGFVRTTAGVPGDVSRGGRAGLAAMGGPLRPVPKDVSGPRGQKRGAGGTPSGPAAPLARTGWTLRRKNSSKADPLASGAAGAKRRRGGYLADRRLRPGANATQVPASAMRRQRALRPSRSISGFARDFRRKKKNEHGGGPGSLV